MNIDQMFPSRYLKASDLGEKDWHLVIDKVVMETIGQGEDASDKPIIYFQKAQKGLVSNKTNMATIAKILNSRDTDNWTGKAITLYATEVQFGAEMVPAIRIRLKAPKIPVSMTQKQTPAAMTQPQQDPEPEDLGIDESQIPF